MNFIKHSEIKDKHAFLSPSKHSWLRYDPEKLRNTYRNYLAVQRGVELHELAAKMITLGVKLPKTKATLNQYVNDAIGFKMIPEQPLYYSDNCFGTADAICFGNSVLRIHDLKTGKTDTSMDQLKIYAALFCLEYGIDPTMIDVHLRIYQNDDVEHDDPPPEEIVAIMDTIVAFDREIDLMEG